jgi:squalene-hopene/tetraprenyl-beta-curcumene cyclase
MARARECILSHGGVPACNTFTKIYLCALGQYDYDAVPAIPPEIVLFPNWFWFNIYEISSWSRAILIPLSICYAKKPFKQDSARVGHRRAVPERHGTRASCGCPGRRSWFRGGISSCCWTACHWFERVHVRPLRSLALRRAEKWMLERLEMSDGLGAIYPAVLNSIIALRCLGYSLDDPQVIRALDEFEKLGIEEDETFRMQPCMSPVWDTAYAMFALGESGVDRKDPAHGEGRRVDAEKADPPEGRLVGEEPQDRARRMVLRAQQRVLSGRGRHAQVMLALNATWKRP